jgi:hypothetical protein
MSVQYFLYLSLFCFFIFQIFSFMPLICLSKFISHTFFVFVTDLFFYRFFVYVADLSVQIYFSSIFFLFL